MKENKCCDICGADIEYRIEGDTEGVFCTRCNWSLVTTHIPKIAQDINIYKMYLCSADPNDKDHLKALAKVANINLLQAKKMAKENKPLIIEDEALAIDKARNILNDLSIKYDIYPSFPY
jgi:hypothetical protein